MLILQSCLYLLKSIRPLGSWRATRDFFRRAAAVLLLILSSLLLLPANSGAEITPPELRIESTPELAPLAARLSTFDRRSMIPAMEMLGLKEPGPPIRVLVVPEGSREAKRAPSWAMAYAVGNAGLVVLIPSRIPSYPDGDMDQVLSHEIAHVLVARASGRYQVPRWFNEGLAVIAAREWRFEDRGRLVLEAFRRRQASMSDVELEFSGGRHSSSSAYAVSVAFVRYLLDTEGSRTAAKILDHVAEGKTFRSAFRAATGRSLQSVERDFWADFDFWNRWVPFLTSSAALWMFVTFIFFLAIRRRREKDSEMIQRWEEEEMAELEAMTAPPNQWVH